MHMHHETSPILKLISLSLQINIFLHIRQSWLKQAVMHLVTRPRICSSIYIRNATFIAIMTLNTYLLTVSCPQILDLDQVYIINVTISVKTQLTHASMHTETFFLIAYHQEEITYVFIKPVLREARLKLIYTSPYQLLVKVQNSLFYFVAQHVTCICL